MANLTHICLVVELFLILNIRRGEQSLLIRKCCPETQILNFEFNVCVNFSETSNNASNNTIIKVSDIITKKYPDFPWWMDSEVQPLSPDTLTNVSSFLEGQNMSKYIKLGEWPHCEYSMRVLLSSRSRFINLLHNGSLVYHAEHMEGQVNFTFSPASYCADLAEDGHFVYQLCACLESICIKKCCHRTEMIKYKFNKMRHHYDVSCIEKKEHTDVSRPTLYRNSTEMQVQPPFVLFHSYLTCAGDKALIPVPPRESEFWINANGSVLVENFGDNIPYPPEQYCWDMGLDENSENLTQYIEICVQRVVDRILTSEALFYGTTHIIAVIFLVLTLIVFYIVPTMRSTYRDIFACHILSHIIAFLTLSVSYLNPVLPHNMCIASAFVVQFSFLAGFFWLNVMCIDISGAFSGIRTRRVSTKVRDRMKFLYYSLYAWGSPTVITIVTAIMQYVQAIPDTYIKPGFGVHTCWFHEKNATLAYFYGPMAALLIANTILFIYTIVKINIANKTTRILHNGNSVHYKGCKFQNDKNGLILCGKLFCLMGLTWITEIISWAEGSYAYYWYVTDAINLLRSVLIFIIFCCTRKVLRLLKQRLHSRGVSDSEDTFKNISVKQSSSFTPTELVPLSEDGTPKIRNREDSVISVKET